MSLRVLIHSWRDLDHPESGGAERYIVTVAEGLAERGHEVTIRTAAYPGSTRHEHRRGVEYVRGGGRLSIYPIALAAQITRDHGADVVVDVQNGMPYLSPLARRGAVVNLVHHVHREQWPILFGPRMSKVGWWLESRVAPTIYRDRPYVAVSASTRRELVDQGVEPSRIRVITNGTSPPPDGPAQRSTAPRLVVVGRLVPQKRVEVALETLARLRVWWPELHLDVVGSGWWQDALVEHADALGVSDATTFHGHVSESEKHRLMGAAWVHLLPSIKEGWGLVVVEAGVHGTPTVAYRHAGGPADSVVDGRTGILVDGGAQEFAAATATLLEDETLRASMGEQVRVFVTQFHWDRAVDAWEEVLIRAVRDADRGDAAPSGDAQEPS